MAAAQRLIDAHGGFLDGLEAELGGDRALPGLPAGASPSSEPKRGAA